MNHLINIFRIPDLARKIFITLLLLGVYRLGYHVPLPLVDPTAMREWAEQVAAGQFGQLFALASMFSGSNLGMLTIFGLGIMPYISASIIMQLLASVIPALEKLQKEGEMGRREINKMTRWLTVGICLVQSAMYLRMLAPAGAAGENVFRIELYQSWFYYGTAVITMTAGTVFLMWLGEQIDEYGIGNGISLLIMAGIVARLPEATRMFILEDVGGVVRVRESLFRLGGGSGTEPTVEIVVVMVLLFLGVVLGVIAMTKAQRRVPMQSARHVRGRRVMGGQRNWLPLRVNQAGVMPIIFAGSLLMIPVFLFDFLAQLMPRGSGWAAALADDFRNQRYIYTLCYIALIYFFCYFWTAITFNPKDIAENLKEYGSFIPGYRPGKSTADYLEKVMVRITYVGAAFLAVVAIVPTIITATLQVAPIIAQFYGGTGLLIVVSVALDLIQRINSHLVMRNYPSLTED
ncbi:MAG: preprotein translocase subunit SecY [Gemmatales bacterium]|nr:preprotein translocase subunit SecY [Gemmatales bacterium]MDW7995304.1 preprotein translocase subunit SecY [Gemmatales bacterium]